MLKDIVKIVLTQEPKTTRSLMNMCNTGSSEIEAAIHELQADGVKVQQVDGYWEIASDV